MTYSIVACSDDGTAWGVAVASKFLAVGALVPVAEAGVGALATQAHANLTYRTKGLALLRSDSRTAEATVAELTRTDSQRAKRQLGVVDAAGRSATYTGDECMEWAGGSCGRGYAVQGNILAGPEVVEAMERRWLATVALPFADRLVAAVRAGDAAGGDRRGRQSAAVLVVTPEGGYGGGTDILVDLRVDDHPDPVTELERLVGLHHLYFDKPDPAACLPLTGELQREVGELLARAGYEDLDTWMGVENYEERAVAGMIDPLVLEKLREAAR